MNPATLNNLLLHNYENFNVVFNHQRFHNHNAHHLGSLYFLGASDQLLEYVYGVMCDVYESHVPSPHAIDRKAWRKNLGDKRFTKAYKDFFGQELTASGNEWHKRFIELLSENESEPMINNVVGGLAHPLIHIGYAFELDSMIVAAEALTQTAIEYDRFHEIIDKLELPRCGSKTALEVFQGIHAEDQLATYGWSEHVDFAAVAEQSAVRLQFHYNQWKINFSDLKESIEELFDLTVYIYGATHKPERIEFDFFILHLLTAMHAIRVIYPHLNDQKVAGHLLVEFFYFASIIYIVANRPKIDTKLIDDYKPDETKTSWNYVLERTLSPGLAVIRHLPKVIHSLKAAEDAYGSKNQFYLRVAVKTVDNLNGKDAWISQPDSPEFLISLKQK